MATKVLEIAIVGTNKSATKAFREVDDAAGTTEGKLRQLGERIGPAVATAAAAVVGTVALAARSAFNAAEESAKISRETERVIRTTGASAWTTADQIGALAQSMSEASGADDELIQSGANLLLTFTQVQNQVGAGNDIFDQATKAALDMSVALGTDMSSASMQLGKALNNPITGMTALRRAGVSFTEQQQDQIKTLAQSGDILGAQKIILAELAKEFGGAAEAAATPVDKLRVKLDNLSENVGTFLVPIVSKAADVLMVVTDSFMALPEPVKAVTVAIGGLGVGTLGAVALVAKLVDVFGDSLKPVMDFARRQFDNAALAVGEMATKMGASQAAGANLAAGLSSAVVPAIGGVMAAATLAFGIWTMYQQGQAETEAKVKAFTDTLDENTGALTENSRANIEKTLTDRNQIDNLSTAKVSLEAYNSAIGSGSKLLKLSHDDTKRLISTHYEDSRARADVVAKLKAEGGERNNLIATLAEQGALDAGLLESIRQQSNAYDRQQQVIRDKIEQQAISNGKTKEEAQAAAEAATANQRHADAIQDVIDTLRAQTDPYFAAFRSQQQLNDAIANYEKVNGDASKSDAEKKAAWVAAAQAATAYKGDLLDLDKAAKGSGATTDALRGQLGNLSQFGLDVTGDAAINATNDLANLGTKADEVGQKEVSIGVTLETRKVKERLDWLRGLADPATGFVPLEALAAIPFAKGGMVPDGLFTVGEQGPELGVKQGNQVRIFSNPESRRMLAPVGPGATGDINVYVNRSDANPYEIGRELAWSLAVTR